MRYIDISLLEPNMILGRSIYGHNKDLMLVRNQKIKPDYIKRIRGLGYQGIYITDRISDDIEVEDIVPDALRMEAINRLHDLYIFSTKNDYRRFDNSLIEINQTVDEMVDCISKSEHAMINMMDLKIYDEYTYYHSVNVATISIAIGVGMGLSRLDLRNLAIGAILHDIGKLRISKLTLQKEGVLTDEEMRELHRHPAYGYRMIRDCNNIASSSYMAILQHHERMNGEGYPHGKKGTDISLFARIIGVADVYDAIISKRPYHDAILPSDAVEYIMGGSGTLFDSEVVKVFLRKVAAYPLSSCVMLSDGRPAIVVKNFEDCNTRPIVRILTEKTPTYVNLRDDESALTLTITGVLNI